MFHLSCIMIVYEYTIDLLPG